MLVNVDLKSLEVLVAAELHNLGDSNADFCGFGYRSRNSGVPESVRRDFYSMFFAEIFKGTCKRCDAHAAFLSEVKAILIQVLALLPQLEAFSAGFSV